MSLFKVKIMKKLYPYLLSAISIVIGIYIGTKVVNGEEKAKELYRDSIDESPSARKYQFINPLLHCIHESKLSMKELLSFQKSIGGYISRAQQQNRDIQVSYYFRDLNNAMWFGVNEHELFNPASLMKVVVMVTVLREAQADARLMNERIRFDANMFKGVEESEGFKKEHGKEYSVQELLNQMIDYSDNQAAYMLLKFMGDDRMTKTMLDLHLPIPKEMSLYTNFIMVKTYADIFKELFDARYLDEDMSEKALAFLSDVNYKGGIRAVVPANIPMAHKYGERDVYDAQGKKHTIQLHHVGIVYYPGKPFLIGIMTKGGELEQKEKIIKDLAKMTYEEVDRQMQARDKP